MVQLPRLKLHNTVLPAAHPNSWLWPRSDCCFPLISRFYYMLPLFLLLLAPHGVQIGSTLFNCVRDALWLSI